MIHNVKRPTSLASIQTVFAVKAHSDLRYAETSIYRSDRTINNQQHILMAHGVADRTSTKILFKHIYLSDIPHNSEAHAFFVRRVVRPEK